MSHPRKGFPHLRLLILLSILLSLHGCGKSPPGSAGPEEGFVSGKVPASVGARIVAMGNGSEQEFPVGDDGSFEIRLRPGSYNILLKQVSGKLSLVSSGVTIEEDVMVSLLDVSLVPIPTVVSVSVPLVYQDSAVIEWDTDIESDGHVDFGTSVNYGQSTYTKSEMSHKHSVQLYSLLPGTTYHFRIVASRHSLEDVQTISRDFAFTTDP